MTLTHWLLFCGVSLLTTFTPGPAVLLAISNSVSNGPRSAMVCSLGNALGLFVVSGVALAGMGLVLATSAIAFTALKVMGALYLVYLGWKQWHSRVNVFSDADQAPPGAPWQLFGKGIVLALTNPKAILFFSALFPQFLTPDLPLLEQFVVLTTSFATCAVMSHAFYALLAHSLRTRFDDPACVRIFNRAAGSLFCFLGFGLLRLQRTA
jgi:threonine/homoserine/homoserine lactone efflux protein